MSQLLACEICHEPNGWVLLSDLYTYVCKECVDANEGMLCEDTAAYRKSVDCRCGRTHGPINYDDETRYCGGSDWCVP